MKSNADDAFGHEDALPFEMPQVLTPKWILFPFPLLLAGSSRELSRSTNAIPVPTRPLFPAISPHPERRPIRGKSDHTIGVGPKVRRSGKSASSEPTIAAGIRMGVWSARRGPVTRRELRGGSQRVVALERAR